MSEIFEKMISEIAEENAYNYALLSRGYIRELSDGVTGGCMYIVGHRFPLNNQVAAALADDKVATCSVLCVHGINHVEHALIEKPSCFGLSENERDFLNMLLSNNHKLVVKPNRGTCGRNVFLVNNEKELRAAASRIFATGSNMAVSIFQEIKTEYRVVILNGVARLVYGKIRTDNPDNPDAWKNNLSCGAVPEIITDKKLKDKLTDIALRVAKVMGLNFASIDIIETEDGEFKVLEANSGVMMVHFAEQSPENYKIAKEIYSDAIKSCMAWEEVKLDLVG